ncbi:DUF1722 domain-containing protein [Hathewaya histolytica]|uniref:Purine nucleoside phosphorylase n=1 Tax=Hathewaya histolytica TaxID=1498 RepID=A0A4U9RJD0_HATHI|nr:DUF1722 domain-containing protein [Hathewaya histolytica]VTQ92055.1 purine nucleoside phosphorylase [Hathewaya histolytica]
MNRNFNKPRIVASKCLGFSPCKYNGTMDSSEFIEELKKYVEFITVCPEVGIGMTTPRNIIRLIEDREKNIVNLVQPSTGENFTKFMVEFSEDFLKSLGDVDGFILKERSPSCGIKEVKIYNGRENAICVKKGKGVFGTIVTEKLGHLPIEDDGRLKDHNIRQHFLTRVFLMRDFREVEIKGSIEELFKFHEKNKLLFMAYSQKGFGSLRKILKNQKKYELEEIFNLYKKELCNALQRAPRYTSNINALMKAMECFKDRMENEEYTSILEVIDKYRYNKVPFSNLLYLVRKSVIRFEEEKLLEQSFFQPYPRELEYLTKL